MTTKFIGVKDFRQNMAKYAKQARAGKDRYVVMNRTKPLFELKPFEDGEYLDEFVEAVRQAEKDVAAGRVFSQEEVMKEFAL